MSYVITAVVVIAITVIATLIRHLWIGNRFVTSLLTGKLDQSRVGRLLAEWFNERPAWAEQRDRFVHFSLGIGWPRGIVADRLMGCIRKVWCGDGDRFGDLLAQEIERLVVFDPPNTPEQTRLQRIALEKFSEFKARLR